MPTRNLSELLNALTSERRQKVAQRVRETIAAMPPDELRRARALEGFAVEEYRSGNITKPDLRRLLGFSTRDQVDGFLKAHAVIEDLPTLDKLELERQDLQTLGLL